MIATLVNTLTVIIGGLLGLLLKGRIAEKYRDSVTVGVGLITLVLGMSMALSGGTILLILPALVLGGLAGTALRIEDGILKSGDVLRKLMTPGEEDGLFARGFLDATILFCVGPMTIVGSIEAGLQGNYDIIFTKSAMDGFMAIVLAASSGAGVIFSALSVLVIQGGLTLGSGALAPLVTDSILAEIGALGGYLILMIALNLLNLKKVKTANFLPSLLLVILFAWGRSFFY
ncbi:MAG: DUF554 domain-containing protein [Spirochaetes bacterium]|nr:MAG: DUF554 domain-containing protein [Spirochaetota bacterium]RKX77633.1 MAG: DUF554 domain-containing protein [Spirochaetota bacterium]